MASMPQILPLIIYSCIIILFVISYIIAVVLISKFNNIQSFEQIKDELESKRTERGRISVVKKIHSYFQKYTFEELLFFNLKFNGKRYYPYYYYFFLGLIAAICISIVLAYDLTPSLILLLILVPSLITLVPMFIFAVVKRRRKYSFMENILSSLIYYIHDCCFKNSMTNLTMLGFFSVMVLALVSSIFSSVIQNRTDINDLMKYSLNYLTALYTSLSSFINLSDFDIEKQSTQLSIAGFYFSLAVGGTVVLSLIDRYFDEADSLRDELLKQANIILDLFRKPDFSLCLNFSDVISFNNENFRNSNREIISSNTKKIEKSYEYLSEIYEKLELSKVVDKNACMYIYNRFILLIVITYILGIIIIFLPESFEIIWLKLFILDSSLFGVSIFIIYRIYRKTQ